jgi:photosystem II stability/assembly factor-like uncharacterized protein
MKRFVSILFLLSLLLTACEAASTPADQPFEDTPTPAPYSPDTPSPPILDLPLVDKPQLITIRFLNSLDGWGVTETRIVRTNDGGSTWYDVTPQDVTEAGYNVDTFVLDNKNVWVHLPDFENYPNSGFLYHTSDGGMTWSISGTPFSRGDIKFLDVDNGWVLADLGVGAGSNAVAVYQTTNGGAAWSQAFINDPNKANAGDSLPLGGQKFGIAPSDMETAWVYGVVYTPGAAYLYRTDNAGQLWEQVSIPLPPEAENADITIEQVEFVTPGNGFLAMRISSDTVNLAIYMSSDGGDTWTLTPTLIPDGGAANFLSAEEAVVYNGSQFYVTQDAGRTWGIIPPDVKFGDTFAAMDFVSRSTGWVVTLDPTTNHRSLYMTADGGATWFPVVE